MKEAMARLKEPAHLQAAKGNPSKRLSAAERRAAEVEARARRLADAPASSGEPLAPPAFMAEPGFQVAIKIWRDLVAQLAEANLISRLDRYSLARYCVHYDDWLAAVDDYTRNGRYKNRSLGHGATKRERNPAFEDAMVLSKLLESFETSYGLSPISRLNLKRYQNSYGAGGDVIATRAEPVGDKPDDADDDLIGLATRHASPHGLQ
jgi:P27 family predicted phage terminase small subunit